MHRETKTFIRLTYCSSPNLQYVRAMSSFSTLMKAVRPVICEAYTQGKYNYGTAAEGPIPRLRKMEILPNSLVGL